MHDRRLRRQGCALLARDLPDGFGGGAFDAPLIPTATNWLGRRRLVPIAAIAGGR